jgi:hypothetical protein
LSRRRHRHVTTAAALPEMIPATYWAIRECDTVSFVGPAGSNERAHLPASILSGAPSSFWFCCRAGAQVQSVWMTVRLPGVLQEGRHSKPDAPGWPAGVFSEQALRTRRSRGTTPSQQMKDRPRRGTDGRRSTDPFAPAEQDGQRTHRAQSTHTRTTLWRTSGADGDRCSPRAHSRDTASSKGSPTRAFDRKGTPAARRFACRHEMTRYATAMRSRR